MNSLIINELSMFSEVLGWTLIHSLWQIGLIAIVLKFVLNFVPQRNAQVRYNLSLFSILAISIWTIVTFVQQLQGAKISMIASSEEANLSVSESELGALNNTNSTDRFMAIIGSELETHLPLLSSIWLLGIGVLLVRLLLNYKQLHRLDQQYIQLPSTEWLDRIDSFCKQLGITREVKLLLSERISEPITFRHFSPVILLPVSMMTGLTTAQVQTLLLHELAHIRRNDYLINLFQSVLEILFFFHPAVWWISRIVREEREHCCDDLVLKHQQHPMLYAEALLQIQTNHYSLKTNLAMSAKGNHKPFTTRIQRLFGQYSTPNSITRGTLAVLLVLGALSVFAFSSPNEQKDVSPEIVSVPQDTIPEKVALVVNLDNEKAREISLVVDRSIAETQDVETLLEKNGIKVDASEIKRVNIYGLEDTEDHPNHFVKRKQDMEDLFDDEVVKLVEIIKDGEDGTVDTLITFELKEHPIKVKPLIIEESPELNMPKKGEIIYDSVDLRSDTTEKPKQVQIQLYGDAKLTDKKPLTIVDGKERSDIHEIDPNNIASISVFKGEAALKKYGENGRDGVVEIITKNGAASNQKINKQNQKANPKPKVEKVEEVVEQIKETPLFIIDGEEHEGIEEVDPKDIESINVLKGEAALQKYGKKAKDGVIEVTTKKKAKKKKAKRGRQLEKLVEISPSPVMESSSKPSIGDTFKVYPNPSDNAVQISGELKQSTKVKIEIFDMAGTLVKKLTDATLKGSFTSEWSPNDSISGTYVVKITTDGKVSSRKVIIK